MSKLKIPGISWSLKRAVGLTQIRQKIPRILGVPTTRSGLERRIGNDSVGLTTVCVRNRVVRNVSPHSPNSRPTVPTRQSKQRKPLEVAGE